MKIEADPDNCCIQLFRSLRSDVQRISEKMMKLSNEARRGVILALASVSAAFATIRPVASMDPDIWWRIRTGEWILANHALPKTEVFAWPVAGRPFTEYSWMFDVLSEWLFRHGGMLMVSGFSLAMAVGIGVALFAVLRNRCHNGIVAAVVAALSMIAMAKIMTPRPWLFTILFFIAEIWLLTSGARPGRLRRLFWLAPLFFLWANIHVQFVYGFVPLGLFAVEYAIQTARRKDAGRGKDLMVAMAAMGAAFASTFLTPFGLGLYKTVFEYAGQSSAFRNISELRPPSFRTWDDYLLVVAVAVAGIVVGRAMRHIEPFMIGLCAVGAIAAFRSERDVWVLIIPAALVVCTSSLEPLILRRKSYAVAALLAVVAVVPVCANRMSTRQMEATLSQHFPVEACDFLSRTSMGGLADRVYTPFDWGGYVMWRLPQSRVSMDGRTNIHGDERVARHVQTGNGGAGWESDPDLSGAGVILVMNQMPLASLLREDNGYRLIHHDGVASVFIHSGLVHVSNAKPGDAHRVGL
ncbi:MAG: hypothetical protein ACR2IF_07860 [Terriglobales bacterium]